MNPVIETMRTRRSVRRYTSEPIDDAALEQLLEAAIWAPSAVNLQPWSFGVIRDRALLERYADLATAIYLTEPPIPEIAATPRAVLEHLRGVLAQPGYELFHGAGTLITIYATTPADIPDCYLAAENLMLAASAGGLGTCPIGLARPLLNQTATKQELGVPPDFVAALPIVVGHPAEDPPATTRKPPNVLYRR
jgi:nitroreductase